MRVSVKGIPAEIFIPSTPPSRTSKTSLDDDEDDEDGVLSEQARFRIFFRILVVYMAQDPPRQKRIKTVLMDVTRRHRRGEDGYDCLLWSLNANLRQCVGETHWARAQKCFDTYCQRRGLV